MSGESERGKHRLDLELVRLGLVSSRSQAESYIKLGRVFVNNQVVNKSSKKVGATDDIVVKTEYQYVSRAALKLESVAERLRVDFKNKTVLDVGSSTGGFSEFALVRGAKKVIAVEIGTNQLHPKLRADTRIELHERTDIRNFKLVEKPDIVVIDVSFVSLREILPSVAGLSGKNTQIIAMLKPQFEVEGSNLKHKGVIKNQSMRRTIIHKFEDWTKKLFVIVNKADSDVAGSKGNLERFYLLRVAK